MVNTFKNIVPIVEIHSTKSNVQPTRLELLWTEKSLNGKTVTTENVNPFIHGVTPWLDLNTGTCIWVLKQKNSKIF